LAARLASTDDLERLDDLARRYGAWMLVATRALPILAEATVLLLGATGLAWRRFWPAVALSNLGIAAVYSVLGHLARRGDAMPLAIAASIALPLLATTMARCLLPRTIQPFSE
jgi:3-dehydroquinate synthase